MKAIIITVICSYVFIFVLGSNVGFLFPGVFNKPETSYFGPVYMGFIFLSALIVACTLYIKNCIDKLNKNKES
ncbi:hypothetical protein [Ornithinibacillus halophilus]|uniref:Uncharacterized protein n=1 Tax=Ornithinibacillus halophilus TaxID=930117 RepID=A0A1M5F271_9BACI|nr:hypothetical protein [Ornithinibacillus halophilus]SHF85547.1 hypothetical protein SAMN05216225_100719 [Ornithinibacillus halophilus]